MCVCVYFYSEGTALVHIMWVSATSAGAFDNFFNAVVMNQKGRSSELEAEGSPTGAGGKSTGG